MFEKILYPTDFSDVAVKALAYVKRLKASGAKEVIVLHVNDERGNESVVRILGGSQFNKLNEKKMEETEKKLKHIEKELVDAGLKVNLRIETGIPVREILRVEDEENVSVYIGKSLSKSRICSQTDAANPGRQAHRPGGRAHCR